MEDADKLRFHCPECDHSVSVAVRHGGKQGKCPGCGATVRIPTVQALNIEPLVRKLLAGRAEDLHELAKQLRGLNWQPNDSKERAWFAVAERRFADAAREGVAAVWPLLRTINHCPGKSPFADTERRTRRDLLVETLRAHVSEIVEGTLGYLSTIKDIDIFSGGDDYDYLDDRVDILVAVISLDSVRRLALDELRHRKQAAGRRT